MSLFCLFVLVALLSCYTIVNVMGKVTVLEDDTISCKTFDSKRIKLVTFDVFAALMDLQSKSSLNNILISSSSYLTMVP